MAKSLTDEPLVSVIMPAYNASKYIRQAIDSILGQSYKNLELIVISDASSDETLEIAKSYKSRDTRIRVFNNKLNKGVAANRTKGIKLARGGFICWQDADDVSVTTRVRDQVDYLKKHKDVGIVGGYLEFIDEAGDSLYTRKYSESDYELRKKIFRYNPVAQPAAMFRSAVYEKVGTYNESYTVSEDLDMFFRAGVYFKFANIQRKVIRYRQLSTSLTRVNLKKMERTTLRLRKAYSKNDAYKYTYKDRIYNHAQQLSVYMPLSLRMYIFRKIRGDR